MTPLLTFRKHSTNARLRGLTDITRVTKELEIPYKFGFKTPCLMGGNAASRSASQHYDDVVDEVIMSVERRRRWSREDRSDWCGFV
jgi:hypothetical protein